MAEIPFIDSASSINFVSILGGITTWFIYIILFGILIFVFYKYFYKKLIYNELVQLYYLRNGNVAQYEEDLGRTTILKTKEGQELKVRHLLKKNKYISPSGNDKITYAKVRRGLFPYSKVITYYCTGEDEYHPTIPKLKIGKLKKLSIEMVWDKIKSSIDPSYIPIDPTLELPTLQYVPYEYDWQNWASSQREIEKNKLNFKKTLMDYMPYISIVLIFAFIIGTAIISYDFIDSTSEKLVSQSASVNAKNTELLERVTTLFENSDALQKQEIKRDEPGG